MKEKELDKLFAQKLSSRQFAFKEAHWEQVSGSIGGRRAGAWWIYLLLFTLLTSAGSAVFYYSHSANGATLQIRNIESEISTRPDSVDPEPGDFISSVTTTKESPSAISTLNNNSDSLAGSVASGMPQGKAISNNSNDLPASGMSQLDNGGENAASQSLQQEESWQKAAQEIHIESTRSPGASLAGNMPGKENAHNLSESSEQDGRNLETEANSINEANTKHGGHGSLTAETDAPNDSEGSNKDNEELLASTAAFLTTPISNKLGVAFDSSLEVDFVDLSLQSLSSLDAELDHDPQLREEEELEEGQRPQDLYVEKRSPWSISLFGGVGISQRELSGGHPQYISKRDKEEKILPTLGGGIELHYHLGKFDFASGVNYSRYGEKPNYSPETTITPGIEESYVTQEIETGYWVVDSLWVFEDIDTIGFGVWQVDSVYFGGTDTTQVLVQDSIWITQTHEFESAQRTWFEYVEIPLMVGYTHSWRKIELSAHGGVSLGILTRHGGNRIAPSLTDYEAEENQPELRRTLLNYQLRVGFGYRILPGTTIIVEPSFRSMGASVFSGSLNQRYRTYGLNIRLNYRF